jgi:hypothetical protein
MYGLIAEPARMPARDQQVWEKPLTKKTTKDQTPCEALTPSLPPAAQRLRSTSHCTQRRLDASVPLSRIAPVARRA